MSKALTPPETPRSHLWRDIWIPLLSTIVALVAVLSSVVINSQTQSTTVELAQFQVTFLRKQEVYADYMVALHATVFAGIEGRKDDVVREGGRLQTAYFALEPFLGTLRANQMWGNTQAVIDLSRQFADRHQRLVDGNVEVPAELTTKFNGYRDDIRASLLHGLFPDRGVGP